MPLINRSADRFQRALDGERITDDELDRLLETSRRLAFVGSSMGPGPDPAFVATLRERLAAEAASMPATSPGASRADGRTAARTAPAVLVVGRGLPRMVAGATASALLVGGVVGLVSRGAVPGDALYPVKGWLDGVAVRLADSDLDRGRTQLDQAQEHISDARDLADRSTPDAGDIDTALEAAISSVSGGQRSLDRAWSETRNPQALLAMRDFTDRALPQVDALRTEVPAASLPEVSRLEALLRQTQEATSRRIAACGGACGGALGSSLGPASLPSTSAISTSGSPSAASTASSSSSGVRVTVPGAPVTGGAGGVPSAPSVSGGTGSVVVGGGGSGATLSTGGATVNLPTLSATLPLPSATLSVPLPSASVGTGGVTATVPGPTLGPVTIPGVTVTIP